MNSSTITWSWLWLLPQSQANATTIKINTTITTRISATTNITTLILPNYTRTNSIYIDWQTDFLEEKAILRMWRINCNGYKKQ